MSLCTLKTNTLLHLIALLCAGAIGLALVSQYVFNMQPCAWCVLQRLIYITIAIVCWLSIITNRASTNQRPSVLQRLGTSIVALLSLSGITAAWYQYSVAAKMFSCDQTFADRFMVQSGLDGRLSWLFGIFATCMDAKVALLGVEYAIWSLALFIIILLLSLIALTRHN